jgi:FSR family fosmidomycin resistance protein-like MFS transporter
MTTASAHPSTLSVRERTIVFALVGAGHTMSHMYILTLPPLFALMKAELGVSYAALGLLATMFHVATGLMQVPAGFLVDRFGAHTMLIVGMLLCSLSMGAVGSVEAYWLMLILTTAAGIGNSVFHPADYAILAASVDKQHLGKAFSFHLMAGNLGFAAAPISMVALAALWDWRAAVIAIGALGLVVGICMLLFGRHLRIADSGNRGNSGYSDNSNAQREASTPGQRAPTASLVSPAMLVMLAFFVLIALATSGINTFSVTVLNALYGTDLGTANTALTIYLSAGFFGIAAGGLLADKLRRPAAVVVVSMLVAALAIALVGTMALPASALFGAMAVGGAATGVMRPARDMMVNAITPPGATGRAFGFVGTGLSAGGAIAPVTFGAMIDIGASAWVFALIVAFLLMGIVTAVVVEHMTGTTATT